jgi:hypothetical protein
MTWRQDGFAHAAGFDDATDRFVGLRAGETVVLADPVGLLVRAEAADAQLEAERPAHTPPRSVAPADGPTVSDGSDLSGGAATQQRSLAAADEQLLRRFFGTVDLDPTRLARDASEVGEAVVAHLNGLVGASVQVTLEIHAEIPAGAPEDVVRTVTENAMTLRFHPSTGFEPE